jgi:adenosylhomocysteinase
LLGYPIYAWKGETEEDFWWCIEKCINAPGWNPNMVNYWGNVTLYIDVRRENPGVRHLLVNSLTNY